MLLKSIFLSAWLKHKEQGTHALTFCYLCSVSALMWLLNYKICMYGLASTPMFHTWSCHLSCRCDSTDKICMFGLPSKSDFDMSASSRGHRQLEGNLNSKLGTVTICSWAKADSSSNQSLSNTAHRAACCFSVTGLTCCRAISVLATDGRLTYLRSVEIC